jgi:hypothetical protein
LITTSVVLLIAFVLGCLGAIATIWFFLTQRRGTAPTASTTAPAAAGAVPAAPAPAAPTSGVASWLTKSNVFWAIGAAIAIGALLYFFGDKTPKGASGYLTAALMVGLGLLLVYKGGTPGLWLGAMLILLALVFGQRVGEVVVTTQDAAAGIVLDDKPLFKPSKSEKQSQAAPAAPTQPKHTIVVGPDNWVKIDVPLGSCIRFWGDNPAGKAFETQALLINHPDWIDWPQYLSLIERGAISRNKLGFVQFKSTGGNANVHYHLRPYDGTCGR